MNASIPNQITSEDGETTSVAETVTNWFKKNKKKIIILGGTAALVVVAGVLISRAKGLDVTEDFEDTESFLELATGGQKRQSPRPHEVSGYPRMTKHGPQTVSPYERGVSRAA